jgi:hypothetical protein
MKLFGKRNRIWTIAVAAATAVVVVLLVLIGVGILIIPGVNSTPTYTVDSISWTILQGTTSVGSGWFGPSHFNSTGPPYPATVTAGKDFEVSIQFSNFDTTTHNITSIYAQVPFKVTGTIPALPIRVPPSEDSARITITVQAPDQSGGSGILNLTVNAYG